jgi:hypothetical protein
LVHHALQACQGANGVHPDVSRGSRKGFVDIYDLIDLEELKEAYLLYISQPGIRINFRESVAIEFYRNTPMLASGIKGMRIQLSFGSD